MYTRAEISRIHQAFWTAFGQYMAPVPFAGGEKKSWINYRTGVPDIFFKMETGDTDATVSITLTQPGLAAQDEIFSQLLQLKKLLHSETGDEWTWQPPHQEEAGHWVSRICRRLEQVNVLKKEDWPAIISFFKQHIMALDAFWEAVRPGFL